MPSTLAIPSIPDLLDDFGRGVRGQKEELANTRRGGRYDHWAGEGAIFFSREAQRDRDLFRACYFDTADGDDLTRILKQRYGIDRIVDAYGTGTASISRPSTSAGAGTIPAGSRILVFPQNGGIMSPRYYAVLSNVAIGASQLAATIPVRAAEKGTGQAINESAQPGQSFATFDDPLWDNSWTIQAIRCDDGTDFEKAEVARARARQARIDARKGYAKAMTDACVKVGAAYVVLFASNFTGDANDYGLNVCYVADASFASPSSLLNACKLALEGYRVLGADLQVLGMTRSALSVSATVTLWDDPGAFNLHDLADVLRTAVITDLDGQANGYSYTRDGWRGAMQSASAEVQSVAFTTPNADATLTTGSPPNFPAVLTRYTLAPGDVQFLFVGPA